MRRRFLRSFFAFVALWTATAPAAFAQAIALPPIVFTDRTLPNGLRTIIVEDHRTPNVAIDVGYRVGGKNDPAGRSGFAHLFEHLMFKGTRDLAPEAFDRLTESIGGYNNAYTAEDITNYYETVPSNWLRTLLWAEADRLAALSVTESDFTTERKVVIGEYDQRIKAAPYGMLDEIVNATAYTAHPYARGVIGSPEQLNSASLADVRAFHAEFYRPDNAVLVIVGDLDPAQTNAWINEYFGPITRPVTKISPVTTVEPPQRAERRTTYHARNITLPAVEMVYHTVAAGDADSATLDVIETLLGFGRSSRMYQSLVYDKQAASGVRIHSDVRAQPGLFSIRATAAQGVRASTLEGLIDAEIDRLKTEPVPAAELAKAKTQSVTAIVRSRQTDDGVAQAIVRSVVERGDPNGVNTDVDKVNAVTPSDIARVASRFFVQTNRTVVDYEPGEAK